MISQNFIEEMKQHLLEAKQKLEAELGGLKPHEELGNDLDSSVQEVEDDEVSHGLITRIKNDLAKIEVALQKIQDGTYGVDSDGNQISEERLKALPWADKAI